MTEKNIGSFKILETIGKGGMGEVFLAHDAVCGRDVALKRMLEKWTSNPTMRERFLREARIAAQLSHPSIIPIYSIDPENLFYTMPNIEGETLKGIFRKTREQMKNGEPLDPIGSSVPALVRIFLSVCGAMAYAHSRGVLHRDLKPENIIVGKYGEVIILDWGLADFIDHPEKNGLDFEGENSHLTLPGKIPGTLLYMAPERALGGPSSVLTDIYSLGVMLYQVLTLQFPFRRKSVKEFRKFHEHEKILDPEEAAPDRDISPHLSSIAKKCLAKEMQDRYQSIDELIKDLEDYIAGLPEWMDMGHLEIENKKDWLFQEHVALAKHMALTRGIDTLEWVNLMVSKSQFPGNIQISTTLTLKSESQGLGILFCVPENNLHKGLEESFCLWFSDKGVHLYRSNVEVLHNAQVCLEKDRPYEVRIEYVENTVRLFLDEVQQFGFLSHIPLPGSRIGLIVRDGKFSISELKVAVGSQNIMVNCLAVPDAFLARKDYDEALREYRKISHSFPGRAEGRESTFRAGMTLLKKAVEQKRNTRKDALFADALDEFEKLHNTPGAPLEYLGKSLVYKAQGELEEEAKCLELSLRKFPKHPLKPILVENLLSRLHESSQTMRQMAYHLALIVLRYLPDSSDAKGLTEVLENSLEPLPFFASSENNNTHLIIQLAFWLNKPLVLVEMLEKGLSETDAQNAQIGLILLGAEDLADLSVLEKSSKEVAIARFELGLKKEKFDADAPIPLWKALHSSDWDKVNKEIETLSPQQTSNEMDPYFFLYGCFIAQSQGEEAALAHLTNVSEQAFPHTSTLLSHYLMGRINLKKGWIEQAFFWEKLKLFQQIELFSQCLGDEKLQKQIKNHEKKL